MTYPSMNDYHEAVQNPQYVFSDIKLKSGRIQRTPLGLPKVASGGFALTYCIEDSINKWAIRCFHKEVRDLQDRYKSISSFLKASNSQYFVNFEYQPFGINIKNKQYPIVMMDWIEGKSLNTYIEDNLNNVRILETLKEQILECSKHLDYLGMAHGDLQHGNILVVNNQIKLIDYDGAYVPGMKFNSSNEIGHVNFQHPLRGPYNFNSTIDRFSFIVIYLALEALIHDPGLWSKFDNGQNLLFRATDFRDPEKSVLLSDLETVPKLSGTISNFKLLCKVSSLEKIVTLNEFLNGKLETTSSDVIHESQPIYVRKRQYEVFDAEDKHKIINQVGNVVEVVGLITDVKTWWTKRKQPMAFVSFGDYKLKCFQIVIWSEGLRDLQRKGITIEDLKGKWVSLTGLVEQYNNSPQIILNPGIKINILQNHLEANAILSTENYTTAARNNKDRLNDILEFPLRGQQSNSNTVSPPSGKNISTRTRNQQVLYEIKKDIQNTNIQKTHQVPKGNSSSNVPNLPKIKSNSVNTITKTTNSNTTANSTNNNTELNTSNSNYQNSIPTQNQNTGNNSNESLLQKFVKGLKNFFG
jgi:hypothetical protein